MTSKTKKISLFIFSLAFGFISVLAPFFAVKSANAQTITNEPLTETYYTNLSEMEVYSTYFEDVNNIKLISSYTYPKFMQNKAPDTALGNTGEDKYTTMSGYVNRTFLRQVSTYSFPKIYTYWDNLDDIPSTAPFGSFQFTNKPLILDSFLEFSEFPLTSSQPLKLHIVCDLAPYLFNSQYEGKEFNPLYTYYQPYHIDKTINFTGAGGSTINIFNTNDLLLMVAEGYSIEDIESVLLRSLTIEFYRTTSQKTTTIISDFSSSYYKISRAVYYNFEDWQNENIQGAYSKEVDSFGLLLAPIQSFLRLELAPGVHVYYLILCALGVSMLGIFIGVLKHG